MALGDVLVEASELIVGQRQKDYGDPKTSLECIAEFWTVWLNRRFNLNIKLEGLDSCEMLSLVKMARLVTGKYLRDDPRDICGYQAILADAVKGGQK